MQTVQLTYSNISKIIGITNIYFSLPDTGKGMVVNSISGFTISGNTISFMGYNVNRYTLNYSGNITVIGT